MRNRIIETRHHLWLHRAHIQQLLRNGLGRERIGGARVRKSTLDIAHLQSRQRRLRKHDLAHVCEQSFRIGEGLYRIHPHFTCGAVPTVDIGLGMDVFGKCIEPRGQQFRAIRETCGTGEPRATPRPEGREIVASK